MAPFSVFFYFSFHLVLIGDDAVLSPNFAAVAIDLTIRR